MKTKPIIKNFLTRAAMTLAAVLMTSATAWADEWDETTKTLTLTLPYCFTETYKGRIDIEHLIIGRKFEWMGDESFSGCTGLKTVTFEENSRLEYLPPQAFEGCTSLTSVNLSNGLKSIKESAFKGCTSLTSVTLPNSLGSIGSSAFEGCTSLTSVTLPDGLGSIGSSAFEGCTSLTSITLPDGLGSIGSSAFEGCTSLTTITIPSNARDVQSNAFKDCTNITTVIDMVTGRSSNIEDLFGNVSSSCHFYFHSQSMYDINKDDYGDRITVFSGIRTYGGAIATTSAEPVITFGGTDYYTLGTQFTISHGDAPNGYHEDFKGYQVKNASGDDITATALSGSTLTLLEGDDISVTALYDLAEYTITYDLDGGEIVIGVGNIAYPTTYTVLSKEIKIDYDYLSIFGNDFLPHRDGYDFLGWTGPGYDEPTKVIIIPSGSYGNRTYTANWQIESYTISYNLVGGSWPEGVTILYSYTPETETFTLNNPTRKGYEFLGWRRQSENNSEAQIDRTIPKGSHGNMVFIAVWNYILDDAIDLADNADNAALISEYEELSVDVTLQGRTLYRDGDWNTLCLPFDVNSFTDTPLAGATVKELNEETSNLDSNGTLTLNFKDATSIKAGKPYIVKLKVADVFIRSIEDWNAFAANVAGGNTYENQTVKLTADIGTSQNPVTTMVSGTFKGTFDGGGHNINAVIRGSGDGTALFYHISGATIKNLRVEGWIKTDGTHPANIAALVSGVSTISNCSCWADVLSTKKLSKIDGGTVVGLINAGATLNMTDVCSSAGITYEYSSSYGGGGIVGWTGSSTTTANLERCLYSPYEIDIQYTGNEPSYYFVSGPGQKNLTKCVYDNTIGASVLTAQGTLLNYNMDDIWKYLTWDMGYDRSLKLPMTVVPDNLENPVFKNMTIDAPASTSVAFDGGQFIGTYSPVGLTVNDRSNLFLGSNNTLYWPNGSNYEDFTSLVGANSSKYYIGAFRAYFHIGNPNQVRSFVLNFGGEDDETTGILSTTNFTNYTNSDAWYDLSGRRLSGKPTQKGLYIHGGKKVVIRSALPLGSSKK